MVMRGAEPVNEELEVGSNSDFEEGWYRAELIGRMFMVLVVLAGLAGLLGRGPFSHRMLPAPDHAFSVEFEPVARRNTPTQVTVRLPADTPAPVRLRVGSELVAPQGLERTQPTALSEAAEAGGLTLTYALAPGPGEAAIRFMLQPSGLGPVPLSVRLGDGPPLDFTQFVLP